MRIVFDANLHIAITGKGNLCPRLQIYNGTCKSDFWEAKNLIIQLDKLTERIDDMKGKALQLQMRCDAEYVKTQKTDVFTKQEILDALDIDVDLSQI